MKLGDGHVRLQAESCLWVDVRRFRDLVIQVTAHGHAPHELCDDCLAALTEVAGLYRNDFLAGFTLKGSAEFDAWQTFTTESLRLELSAALAKLVASLADRQQYDLALPHARRRLALNPLDETSHRWLMQLYVSSGDRAAATRQYEECARVLAAELGIEPAPETTLLYHEAAAEQAGRGDSGGCWQVGDRSLRDRACASPAVGISDTAAPDTSQLTGRSHAVHRPTGRAEPGRRTTGRPGVPAAHGPRPWWHRKDAIGRPDSPRYGRSLFPRRVFRGSGPDPLG